MQTDISYSRAYTLRIRVPSGVPEGLRIVSKDNWVGQGALFSRSLYPAVLSVPDFDFNRTGVYVLWESAELGNLPRVYVGEAQLLAERLKRQVEKDFWTDAVAFSASDQSINEAHALYIEARLVKLADEAKSSRLQNTQVPRLRKLSDTDKDTAENYLAHMMTCLPVLGINFFEKAHARHPMREDFYINTKGVRATGFEDVSGFVVKAKSQATKRETTSIHRFLANRRRALVEGSVLRDVGDVYEFTDDYAFSSPSVAAGVILGRSTNGRTDWKDADGRTLKRIQEERIRTE